MTSTTENRFGTSFGVGACGFVCNGDTITADVDGFEIIARLEHDHDTTPEDYLDPDGIGEDARHLVDWGNGLWSYVGVVLSVHRNGVELDNHAASLWGIEANMRNPDGSLMGNEYLTEVANELLDEALIEARAAMGKLFEGWAA